MIVKFCVVILFLVLTVDAGKGGGKTAGRVGLAAVSSVGLGKSDSYQVNYESIDDAVHDPNRTLTFKSGLDRLKHQLLVVNQYDKAIRPVKHHNSSVRVMVDFTTRQILDLNEKNQVLKSYMHYRLFWKDEFLVWDPDDFDNLTSIWLPTSVLWRPDIVIYEDTGNRDYSPRMPFVEVTNEGMVRYLEPTVFETSCSVNIAHFPFDYQICTLTFTPWTFPSSKIDISSRRTKEQMENDVESYLIRTGEWKLQQIEIKKRSQSFASVFSNNQTTNETDEKFKKIVYLPPVEFVNDIMPSRMTDLHWSEVIYILHLRRNSSLYMQSMLFPAILLTTIALLGFYLPPDSGERIGLQITILLTFMVFLLNVGEMFPASSSGPYLGLYYVICMGLLGINLLMTVLVLHMHYMPPAAVIETARGENGELVPRKLGCGIRLLIKIARGSIKLKLFNKKNYPDCELTRTVRRGVFNGHYNVPHNSSKKLQYADESRDEGIEMQSKCNGALGHAVTNGGDNIHLHEQTENQKPKKKSENHLLREKVFENLKQVKSFLSEENEDLKERSMMAEVEDEWKAMARVIDDICLKVYLGLLVVCHIAILVAAVLDEGSKGDPLQNH